MFERQWVPNTESLQDKWCVMMENNKFFLFL